MVRRFHSFSFFMKNRFGRVVHKVSVDAGFTCPNRDGSLGTSGCIYCNNDCFRPSTCKPGLSVSKQVKKGIDLINKKYGTDTVLAYFQPYTNTYGSVAELERVYGEALANPSVIGLVIGTRPDAIDAQKIALLQSLAKKYFVLVEYGMQSMYDKTLDFISRGHDYNAFLRALALTENRGIFIGAHIIAGFPTETKEETLSMADEVSHLPIDFLKIHHLQVVKDTPLDVLYRENPFHLFGYDEYLDFIVAFMERLSPKIVIQRLFATAPDHLLIAPRWNKNRQETLQDIEAKLLRKDTWQGKQQKMNVIA
jgi:hypothetical protein